MRSGNYVPVTWLGGLRILHKPGDDEAGLGSWLDPLASICPEAKYKPFSCIDRKTANAIGSDRSGAA
ncbi:uncharacterized protein CLUP02_05230 [Colletotrichum lupini]|uniref:Uncharacterized protein n=1 Tax=Colletotrichum lupini TaxID=145971 RepID=A0A9Q8SMR2_9PEZI|nr:uncharacterized protein CLUP02_05230 [Colletotrichum lupini]UQC79750.1 hypothetical protein CLUP02_05230 [Colletotrichum lupini]